MPRMSQSHKYIAASYALALFALAQASSALFILKPGLGSRNAAAPLLPPGFGHGAAIISATTTLVMAK